MYIEQTKPVDTVFLVDVSEDSDINKIKALKVFLKSFVSTYEISPNRNRISFVTFESEAVTLLDLNGDVEQVLEAINYIEFRGKNLFLYIWLKYYFLIF